MPKYLVDPLPYDEERRLSFEAASEQAPRMESSASEVPAPALEPEATESSAEQFTDLRQPAEPVRKRVLVAGGSGAIGYPLLALAKDAGYWVRSLSKSRWRAPKVSLLADDLWLRDATDRDAIRGICQGVDVVVSCLGGSLDPRIEEKRGFLQLDFNANRHLLDEAVEANVRRFVYVSVYGERHLEDTSFVRAHRRFEEALSESGIEFTILRFAGLHATPDSLIAAARERSSSLVGHSDYRTNPIHPEDAAQICFDHLNSGPQIVEAGGPDIFTRRELSELIYGYAGTTPKAYRTPYFLKRLSAVFTRPFNPRLASLREFAFRTARTDVIAPRMGTRRFASYLLECRNRSLLAQESV
ncbi:MAG: NAD(P)H-binding protein [Bryobacterales bacterium]|nr:NAD(P)H-binding protein [Bryobacterales bacterium]